MNLAILGEVVGEMGKNHVFARHLTRVLTLFPYCWLCDGNAENAFPLSGALKYASGLSFKEGVVKKWLALFCAAAISGCATQDDLRRERVMIDKARGDLDRATLNSVAACKTRAACDKAFSLTKAYVQENSDMKIQFADDTMVFTYNPLRVGQVALRATRTPDAGDSATIRLDASCKGMNERDNFRLCAHRMEAIYNGFKPYVESRL